MSKKIIQLVFCHDCHTHIKPQQSFVSYQNKTYCDPCFEGNFEDDNNDFELDNETDIMHECNKF